MNDTREPVYRKINGRYKAFASLNDSWSKFDPWNSEGIWLHYKTNGGRGMCKIASLDDLPSSVVVLGAAMKHREELTTKILKELNEVSSCYDKTENILNWIASKANQ